MSLAPSELLKTHTRLEAFRLLVASVRDQTLVEDRVRLADALFVAGLSGSSAEGLAQLRPQEPAGVFPDMADYVPALLGVARQSPYQEVRAMAVSELPTLDQVGTRYGTPETLPDPQTRLIYAAKLGDHARFGSLIPDVKAKAAELKTTFLLRKPPISLFYAIDRTGPCMEEGPGLGQGTHTALTEDELYELLRVAPDTPDDAHGHQFNTITGNFHKRQLSLDTALLVVDVQNDFLPAGALPVPDGDVVVPWINRLQYYFGWVIMTQDWHPANHGSFAANHPGKKPGDVVKLAGMQQILWPVHCVQNTPGAYFAPGLFLPRCTKTVQKGTDPQIDSYSGFFDNGHLKSTGLDDWLKGQGVREVFVCGLATDYCVKFTALDSVKLGFKTHVIEDASRGVNLQPGDVNKAIEEMTQAGIEICRSNQLVSQRQSMSL